MSLILASDDAGPDSNTVIHVVKIFRMCETLSAKAILSQSCDTLSAALPNHDAGGDLQRCVRGRGGVNGLKLRLLCFALFAGPVI